MADITVVVNLRKAKYDVYIGRGGRGRDGYFGNPHTIGWCKKCKKEHDRDSSIRAYKLYFWERVNTDLEFRERVLELRGKVLGCFCKPKACHGDMIVAWLEAGAPLGPDAVHK